MIDATLCCTLMRSVRLPLRNSDQIKENARLAKPRISQKKDSDHVKEQSSRRPMRASIQKLKMRLPSAHHSEDTMSTSDCS